MECRKRSDALRSGVLQPLEPPPQIGLVDAGDRGEATGGVAIHRRIADSRLGAVACGDEQRPADVRQHPHPRRPGPRLDVLQGDVVGPPVEWTAHRRCGQSPVVLHDAFHVELMKFGTQTVSEPLRGVSGHGARVRRRLVDADQHGMDQPAHASFSIGGNGVVARLLR